MDEDSDAYYANLVEATQGLYNKVPQFYSFFGPVGKECENTPPPKQRKTPAIKTVGKLTKKKAPEKITHAEKEEDSVDDTVKFLQWSLTKEHEENNGKPISYYHFLIDPNSFSTSIENLFHMSFLIRDGRVKMESGEYFLFNWFWMNFMNFFVDNSGNIFISPVSNQEMKRTKKGLVDYTQYMFAIDMEQWNVRYSK